MKVQTESGISALHPQEIAILTKSQRLKRAAKGFGLYFVIALAAILVPILHFVLVPFFLVFSFYVGFSRYNQIYFFDLNNVACPKCLKALNDLTVFSKNRVYTDYCYDCRINLKIE